MKIATVLNVHADPLLVADTIESIQCHMTDDILVVRDGATKHKRFNLTVPSIVGFYHNCPRAPYRNVALGLNVLTSHYDADWYCYMEYDCLVASDMFRKTLEKASEMNVWMLGCAGRVDEAKMPLLDNMFGTDLSKHSYYLLGCCQFFSKEMIKKIKEINFFERFLSLTNQFSEGYFPGYNGYDPSEHLYPTLARFFGANIGVFSTYHEVTQMWHGNHEYFPMRFRPELESVAQHTKASILHPLKSYDHPIREYHRERRKKYAV